MAVIVHLLRIVTSNYACGTSDLSGGDAVVERAIAAAESAAKII